MGARFNLRHANLMAYVASRSFSAPRARAKDVEDFLVALEKEPRKVLISEPGSSWTEDISKLARDALKVLAERRTESEAIMPGGVVERVLEELRFAFSDHPLFALAVGNSTDLKETAERLAREPLYGSLVVLIPEHEEGVSNFEVLDPIPSFSLAVHHAADWPGLIFWTPLGTSAFVVLDQIDALVSDLREASWHELHNRDLRWRWGLNRLSGFDELLRAWASRARPSRNRRLLHLSDLHFGTDHATANQPMLEAELRDVVRSVDRVVITGDLMDSPKDDYFNRYAAFRNTISHHSSGKEPIAITGNHDQRLKGLIGKDYEQVAKIKSSGIEVDDEAQMTFVMLNSSIEGQAARGAVTAEQLQQVGAQYRTLVGARDELKAYLPVVLVHHHPFSFDLPPETTLQKVLKALKIREEAMLELADAHLLHRWCLDWQFSTILHGHKHKARYVCHQIADDRRSMELTAIGCGSSLGAEGSPVSYNLLEWHPEQRRWIASLHESVNGGAFREVGLSVSPLGVQTTPGT